MQKSCYGQLACLIEEEAMTEEKFLTDGFFHGDVHFAVQELGLTDVRIKLLYQKQNGDKEQRVKEWQSRLSNLEDNVVVLTSAFISTDEFPESDWCLEEDSTDRKLIPVNDVLERECAVLESAGFVNVNDFIRYENKEAYVWPNEAGKKIIELFKKKLEQ